MNPAKNEQTSKRIASTDSKLLRNPHLSKALKSVATSAFTQARSKKK